MKPVGNVGTPATAGRTASILLRLMDEYGAKEAWPVSPRNGRRIRRGCDTCGLAEWSRSGLSFRCPQARKGKTLGIVAGDCRYWKPLPGIVVYDEDTGDVYLT